MLLMEGGFEERERGKRGREEDLGERETISAW
jgi:hypothetical protein